MLKKTAAIFLSLALIFTVSVPVTAAPESETTVEDVRGAISSVTGSLGELKDTAANAKELTSTFESFMNVVTNAGRVLTLVNGSTTFLRLIGVMTDPTQAKLDGILSKLQTIDERLSSMDDKLNDLTSAMSELKASEEFNTRTEKAILYEGSWRDFEYRYMENGMDKLITQYNSMLRTGLMNWCNGKRNENGVATDRLILLYKKGEEGYTLTYSDANGIPSDFTEEDRWLILSSACLPAAFSYDVNTFGTALASEIEARINDATVEAHNFPSYDKKTVAADAVNTLIYRVACAEVNGNATFAGEVSRQFSNYCNHLQTAGDGIDAALKTFYLTHAFEYSVADDIRDFCDRMIVLTGTYGVFASHVLGISHLTTDDEKIAAVSQMTAAVKTAEQAKTNGITGKGNYCYITGTNLVYATVTFDASAELQAHYTMSNTAYQSFKGTGPTATYGGAVSSAVPAGDTAMILVVNTLQSNGITVSHDYLNENIGNGSVKNCGQVVTAYSALQTLSFDGKTKLHVKNAFGDYFKNNSTITSLPSDAESEYVVYRKKISGSLFNLSDKTLVSNTTLCAVAVYGENHFYWVTDEGAFMGGPSNSAFFTDSYSVAETGSDFRGKIRLHRYDVSNTYNILLSVPQKKLSAVDGYNPLTLLEEEVAPCVFDSASLNENDGSASQDTFSLPEEETPAKETDYRWLYAIGAAVVLIGAAAVTVIILRKKRKQ